MFVHASGVVRTTARDVAGVDVASEVGSGGAESVRLLTVGAVAGAAPGVAPPGPGGAPRPDRPQPHPAEPPGAPAPARPGQEGAAHRARDSVLGGAGQHGFIRISEEIVTRGRAEVGCSRVGAEARKPCRVVRGRHSFRVDRKLKARGLIGCRFRRAEPIGSRGVHGAPQRRRLGSGVGGRRLLALERALRLRGGEVVVPRRVVGGDTGHAWVHPREGAGVGPGSQGGGAVAVHAR